MSNVNEDFSYLCNQLKHGIIVGAGVTLFTSGVLIGIKTASFILDIAGQISSDGISALKESLEEMIMEEEEE